MKLPKNWPQKIGRGHSTVKIYRTPSNGCDQFTVAYYMSDKRVRKTFAKYELATIEADKVHAALCAGELKVVELKGEDCLSYLRAKEAIKETGMPLEMVAIRYADAHRLLGGASLTEAVEFFLKHHPNNLPKKTVPVVVEELLNAKDADGMSDVYLKDLRLRLERFAKKFPRGIALITTAEVEDFLRDLKKPATRGKDNKPVMKSLTGRSRNNYRRAIGTLFYFAETRGYLPKGNGRIEAVAVAREEDGDIDIFTPAELEQLFKTAWDKPELIPFLAIAAFAGLRHAEITRLEWPEIRLDDGFIEVKARKAKTASRRLVPITPNLRAWLEPLKQVSGHVVHHENMPNQIQWLAYHSKVSWKHNALRHSFISYRLAQVQNTAQVALEAGNSPQMVFQHYRELVRPADAEKWFAITPDTVPKPERKIIPLAKVA
jgi:integrase